MTRFCFSFLMVLLLSPGVQAQQRELESARIRRNEAVNQAYREMRQKGSFDAKTSREIKERILPPLKKQYSEANQKANERALRKLGVVQKDFRTLSREDKAEMDAEAAELKAAFAGDGEPKDLDRDLAEDKGPGLNDEKDIQSLARQLISPGSLDENKAEKAAVNSGTASAPSQSSSSQRVNNQPGIEGSQFEKTLSFGKSKPKAEDKPRKKQ